MKMSGPSALLTASDLSLAGGWTAILATLDIQSSLDADAGPPQPLDLKDLSTSFSFSALLSPATPGPVNAIEDDGQTLHSTYLVCLALNEECRAMARGGFYFLPVQDRAASRPCDMVFVDEPWGPRSIATWDGNYWSQRLSMFPAMKKINAGEEVIPIITRIFQLDGHTDFDH